MDAGWMLGWKVLATILVLPCLFAGFRRLRLAFQEWPKP
jgi:hypothetical protein